MDAIFLTVVDLYLLESEAQILRLGYAGVALAVVFAVEFARGCWTTQVGHKGDDE